MICPHCGNEIPQGARFCDYCGQDVTAKPPDQSLEQAQEQLKSVPLSLERHEKKAKKKAARNIVILIVVILVVIVVALTQLTGVFSGGQTNQSTEVQAETAEPVEETTASKGEETTAAADNGTTSSASLGILWQYVDDEVAAMNNSVNGAGAVILGFYKNSPELGAGLKIGDVIKQVDDAKITTSEDLKVEAKSHKAGEKVTFVYCRQGNIQSTEVTMSAQEDLGSEPIDKSTSMYITPETIYGTWECTQYDVNGNNCYFKLSFDSAGHVYRYQENKEDSTSYVEWNTTYSIDYPGHLILDELALTYPPTSADENNTLIYTIDSNNTDTHAETQYVFTKIDNEALSILWPLGDWAQEGQNGAGVLTFKQDGSWQYVSNGQTGENGLWSIEGGYLVLNDYSGESMKSYTYEISDDRTTLTNTSNKNNVFQKQNEGNSAS